jgi:uncharacterized protein with von Willebrand factor type A (vWA) domain
MRAGKGVFSKQRAARMDLERELLNDEEAAMGELMKTSHQKREQMLEEMSDKLAFKLQGDQTQKEVDAIMAAHEAELSETMRRLDQERDKQAAALRDKLAHRRREKTAALREKHAKEVGDQLIH